MVVPNGDLIASELVNWTLFDSRRRVEIAVGVAYGTDPETVLELLAAIASADPNVLAEPEPKTRFVGFGDSTLDFSLRIWCAFEDHIQIGSDLRVAIISAFIEAGITIPIPQRDVHLRTVAGAAITVPGDDSPTGA